MGLAQWYKIMELCKVHELRVRLKALELSEQDAHLSFIERLEIKDEILEIKEKLGEFQRQVEGGEACENCSG